MGCLILQTDDKLMTGAKVVVLFFFNPQKVNLCEHVLKRGHGATTKKKKIQICILLNVKKVYFCKVKRSIQRIYLSAHTYLQTFREMIQSAGKSALSTQK